MKKRIRGIVIDLLFYIVGCSLYSAAVTMLITANSLSPGGLTGVSTVLNYAFGLPAGLTVWILNIPIVVYGFIKLGGMFIVKTAVATTVLSITLELSERFLPRIKTDNILAGVFGGLLMGVGLSLVLLRGATTGGVDIIAKLINKKFRHITVGRIILFTDAAVIMLAAFVYKNIESALYSVIALYASSYITDIILYGSDKGKILYVVTTAPDPICAAIGKRLDRGVTRLSAVGGYTCESRTMLMCIVRRHEVSAACDIINEFDSRAFIVISEAGEIIGEGFKLPERK